MRKWKSQISVALVCCLLGFMLTYQFKAFLKADTSITSSKNNTDVVAELEQLKKERDSLKTKIEEQEKQLENYEKSAVGKSEITKNLLEERNESKTLLGLTDVEGEGVNIYLDPENSFIGGAKGRIQDYDLVYIINELRFAGAEAISINDIRITGKSGIRNSANFITINFEDKVSPSKKIVIKAIGNKNDLYSALSFAETLARFNGIAEVKYEKSDSIKILKYNKSYKNKFAKPVEK